MLVGLTLGSSLAVCFGFVCWLLTFWVYDLDDTSFGLVPSQGVVEELESRTFRAERVNIGVGNCDVEVGISLPVAKVPFRWYPGAHISARALCPTRGQATIVEVRFQDERGNDLLTRSDESYGRSGGYGLYQTNLARAPRRLTAEVVVQVEEEPGSGTTQVRLTFSAEVRRCWYTCAAEIARSF